MKRINEMEILKDILKPLKWGILVSNLMALAAIILCLRSTFAPPIVVLSDGTNRTFFWGERKSISVTEENIKNFLKDFIMARYGPEGRDTGSILENISPMVTKGLFKKIKQRIEVKADVRRGVSSVEISFAKKGAWVSFYLIEELKGIPFVVGKKLFVQLTRGSRTRWNPMGIHINRITVYDKNAKGD